MQEVQFRPVVSRYRNGPTERSDRHGREIGSDKNGVQLDMGGLKWPDPSGAEAAAWRLSRSCIRKRVDMFQLFDLGNGLFNVHAASNIGSSPAKYGRTVGA